MTTPLSQDDQAIVVASSQSDPLALLSNLKEESILLFYYGPTSVSPTEFIDCQLDQILLGQLNEQLTFEDAQEKVKEFLSNYQHWACTAKFLTRKSYLAVSFSLKNQIIKSFYHHLVARISRNQFKNFGK